MATSGNPTHDSTASATAATVMASNKNRMLNCSGFTVVGGAPTGVGGGDSTRDVAAMCGCWAMAPSYQPAAVDGKRHVSSCRQTRFWRHKFRCGVELL
jgi:hypothetical protein